MRRGSGYSPASGAFWAVTSFDGKRELTNAAVEARLGDHPFSHYQNPALLAEWTKIYKRVGEKSRKRNKLAHGAVLNRVYVPYYYKSTSGHSRLFADSTGSSELFHASTKSHDLRDEMNALQINAICEGFNLANLRLTRFFIELQAHNIKVSSEEVEAQRFYDNLPLSVQSSDTNPPPPQLSED